MTDSTAKAQADIKVQETDYWVRSVWIWSFVYYGSLLVPTAISLLNPTPSFQDRIMIVAWTAVGSFWHWLWTYRLLRRVGNPHRYPARMAIYVIGVFAVWFFLVQINPVFYFHLAGTYSQIYIFLPPTWAISFTVLASILIFGQQSNFSFEQLDLETSLFWTLMTAIAIVFYLWIRGIIVQSEQRNQLIQQLKATQAELAASEHRAGVLSERQRLAQEIHDTLAQGFTSIVMHMEAAEQALTENAEITTEETAQHIDQARQTARASLEQARRLVWELRPQSLEEATLPEAIDRAGQKWAQESGIPCEVNSTGQVVALHPQIEITLLRAAQEALNNVRKHAQADEVCMTITYFDDLVVLDVQDNGQGFDTDVKQLDPLGVQSGYGLTAMRQRVEKLDGKLLVESGAGEGTTLVIEIPVSG
jgi:signal transduction histidine kinase